MHNHRRPTWAPDDDTGGGAPAGDVTTQDEGTTTTETTDDDAGKSGKDDKGALQAARREAAANRKRVAELEEKVKGLEDANLSEQEKVKKRADELEARTTTDQTTIRALRLELAVAKAAPTIGIIDAESAVALIDQSRVEFDKDGAIVQQSVEDALKELADRKPFLRRIGSAGGGAGGTDDDNVVDMNQAIRSAAGRR